MKLNGLPFQQLCWACIAVLLSACTTPSHKTGGESPPPKKIAILTTEHLTAVGRPESKSERTGKGAVAGLAVGAASGAAIGAASCAPAGPYAGLCAVVGALQGMFYGGLIGGAVGGVAYGHTGISNSNMVYINEVMSSLDQERDFQSELLQRLIATVPAELQAEPGVADLQTTVTFDHLEFIQSGEDELKLKATATLYYSEKAVEKRPDKKVFHVVSSKQNIDALLAEDGRKLGELIDECHQLLARDITTTLLAFSNQNGKAK